MQTAAQKNSTSIQDSEKPKETKTVQAQAKTVTASKTSPAVKPASVKVASRGTSKKTSGSTTVKISSRGMDIVNTAREYIGSPYVYGASGPSSFDCSGFTMYIMNKFNVSLPHSAKAQSGIGKYVPRNQLRPGDLVVFTTNGTGSVSHTGIYIGGGKFVHAPESGKNVSISSMTSGYYSERYITARRVVF